MLALVTEQPVPEPGSAAGDPHTPGPAADSVSPAAPPQCPTRTRLYRAGRLLDEGFPAELISELLAADQHAVVWLDLYDPTQADLQIDDLCRHHDYAVGGKVQSWKGMAAGDFDGVGPLLISA